jgi:hypothetical protein
MPDSLPPGPYKLVQMSEDGRTAPWYVIPFDKKGTCTAPLTRNHLVDAVGKKQYTDVFLFSHGWNNDWDTASERYEDFVAGFIKMRRDFGLKLDRDYRPLLVGVFWPSTALVLPWERAPKFAGTPANGGSDTDAWRRELEELADLVADEDRSTFYELAQKDDLSEADATRLAKIIADATRRCENADAETFGGDDQPLSANELLRRARAMPNSSATNGRPGEFSFATGAAGGPAAAFSLSSLDPRKLIRLGTVLQMKDRAARVGAHGVGALVTDVLQADTNVRLHLVGHSYGAIVVLSAVCFPKELPAQVQSMLLLQPAVSQWCFAANVRGKNFPGGYRPALDRVKGTILTTFSKHDGPLTSFFHLAARRDRDLGQPQIAGDTGLPKAPSEFAALGGFGPAGLSPQELTVLPMQSPATRYTLGSAKICALNGNVAIAGHGDISVPATWWALFQQVE